MWGLRVMLGKVDLMQFNSREPWGIPEQRRGLMILLFGERSSSRGPILALFGVQMRVLNKLSEGSGSSSGSVFQLPVGF